MVTEVLACRLLWSMAVAPIVCVPLAMFLLISVAEEADALAHV
jgi:hypothetical protein